MASMTHQYCFGASMSLRKTHNISKFCVVHPSDIVNSRNLSNLVVSSNILYSPTLKSIFPRLSSATKRQPHVAAANKNEEHDRYDWRILCSTHDDPSFSPWQLTDNGLLIQKLFFAIDTRNEQLLNDVLSSNCVFDDPIFRIDPSGGKESIIRFLWKVKDATGPNIGFRVDDVTNCDDGTATVIWHLEWDDTGKIVQFTSSQSVFECEEVDDDKLLIRKITGLGDKPGDFVLKLLKAASTDFRTYPDN